MYEYITQALLCYLVWGFDLEDYSYNHLKDVMARIHNLNTGVLISP